MRVLLKFEARDTGKRPSVVEMEFIPQAGDLLLNERNKKNEVIKVVHTPGDPEQDVILELREKL